MKKKELKNIAEKIAMNEIIISTSKDKTKIANAKEEILRLSGRIENLEDLDELDALITKKLKKK